MLRSKMLRASSGFEITPLAYEDTTVIGTSSDNGNSYSPSNNVSWNSRDTLIIFAQGRIAGSLTWNPASMTLTHTDGDSFTNFESIRSSGDFGSFVVAFLATTGNSNIGTGTWSLNDNTTGEFSNITLTAVRFSGSVGLKASASAETGTNVSPTVASDSFVAAAAHSTLSATNFTYSGATTVRSFFTNENGKGEVFVHSPTETSPFTITESNTTGVFVSVVLTPV